MKSFGLIVVITILVTACAAPRLPENVSVSPDGKYVDRMVFSGTTKFSADVGFGHLKTCIAEIVSNEGVDLKDSAGSFVGVTGNYYQIDRAKTTQGGDTLQAVDAESKTIIAKGVFPYSGGAPIKLAQHLKFTMRAKASDGAITLTLSQISSAQDSTGYLANSGFSPLGTWAGSTAGDAYAAAEAMSKKVVSCISDS